MSTSYSAIINFLRKYGSLSSQALASRIGREEWEVEGYLLTLEASGAIVLNKEGDKWMVALRRFPGKDHPQAQGHI